MIEPRVDPDRDKGWVSQLLLVSAPRVLMAGIDTALVQRTGRVEVFAAVLVGIGLARLVANSWHRRLLFATSAHLEHDLRALVQKSLSRQTFSWYDRNSTGALISRANSDIRAIERFLTFMPAVAVTFLGFGLAVGLMLSIHVGLALVAMAPLPFVYLGGTRMRRALWPIAWLVQSRTADVTTVVEENLAGAHVVRGMSAEPAQIGRLERSAERLRWIATEEIVVRARYEPVIENVPRLGVAAVLLYGGMLAIDEQITLGALVAFAGYVALMQQPFRLLGFIVVMGQRASASSSRVLELLDAEPEIAERADAVVLADPVGDVVVESVRFGYGDGPEVLDGVDLRLRPGETVALVGRTGCGKSTVARLLPRFYDVRSGRITVDGVDVRDLQLESLRRTVGVVTDEPFLFSASVRDNIAYGRPDATLDEVIEVARIADAAEFVERLPDGYDTVVGERGYTLSGGQRQRIAIARTLLVNPRVLVLDDATSAIDVEVERRIHAALEQLLAGRTTLLVAHRLSTIALADRVVLLDGGRVVADGTHLELLRDVPLYAEVLAQSSAQDAA